jgi:hypothetical protein
MSDSESRRRWVTLGEIIALLALVVSAAGLWLTWRSSGDDRPTRVVEQKQAIPLTLRGKADNEGRQLVIEPVKDRDESKGTHSVPVRIAARYVEMGKDRTGDGSYVLRYRWEGGGLFGDRSLKLTGFGR